MIYEGYRIVGEGVISIGIYRGSSRDSTIDIYGYSIVGIDIGVTPAIMPAISEHLNIHLIVTPQANRITNGGADCVNSIGVILITPQGVRVVASYRDIDCRPSYD